MMIVLFTDFGLEGPYIGQVKAVLWREAPGIPVIDLFADAPAYDPQAAAYLLAAYVTEFPLGTVFLAVVDPGVGSETRKPVVVDADGRWFVGPGNGLFNVVVQRAGHATCSEITWRPQHLSRSFHGRDLFAPVAARLARKAEVPRQPVAICADPSWPHELNRIIYIDHFGNAMTGIRAGAIAPGARLRIKGHDLERADVFADVRPGQPFWYENANGLVEIAVNRGRADTQLAVQLGDEVVIA